MEERDIECRWVIDASDLDEWASKIDRNTRFLYGELPSNPRPGLLRHPGRGRPGPQPQPAADCATRRSPRPPCCGRSATGPTSWCSRSPRRSARSGFGVCGAVIARKNLTTNIDNEATAERFRLVRQVPAEPRLRPEPAPDAGGHGPERHADPAVEDRPDEPQHDAGGRVPRSSTRPSRACSTSVCRAIRCTSWPAATCGWSTPSTTSCTASR